MNIGMKTLVLCLAAGLWVANAAQGGTTAYRDTVLGDNPLVYYEFDEASGTTATNSGSTGVGNTGAISTIGGTVTINQLSFPQGGSSYDFGGGHVLAAPAPASLTEWSLEAWINWDPAKTSASNFFGNDQAGWNNDVLFGIGAESGGVGVPAGNVGLIQQGSPGTTRDYVTDPLTPSEWHHVVATGSTTNGELKLYVDGALKNTDSSLVNGITLNGAGGIGTSFISVGAARNVVDAGYRAFDGQIDEFALYETVLDATAVEAHYDAGGMPDPPDPPDPADVSWSMVVLADTHGEGYFPGMTQWIVDNKDTRSIKVMLHNGDMVNTNNVSEWEFSKAAMTTLDGQVPYMINVGNHEYGEGYDLHGRETLMGNYFALADNPLNNSPANGIVTVERVAGDLANTYSTFTAPDGRKMLIFSLEFGPRQEVVDWANSIASQAQYEDYTAVLSTHAYMDLVSQGDRDSARWNPNDYGVDTHDGEELWDELVSVNGNFEMTFNGHYIGAVDRQVSVGDDGNIVHEMVHNRQHEALGYMRLLEFLDDGKTIQVRTYCTNGTWLTDPANEFQIVLSELFAPGTMFWQAGVTDNWTSENWSNDGGASYVFPIADMPMTINSGTVTVAGGVTATAAGALSIGADGALNVSGTLTATGLDSAGDTTINTGSTATITGDVTITGGTTTIANGALTVGGLLLVDGGSLAISDSVTLDALTFNAGGFDLGGNTLTLTTYTQTGGTASVASGALRADEYILQDGTVDFSMGETSSSNVTVNGGTVVLQAGHSHTYTGATTVASGELVVNSSIASTLSLTIDAGARLTLGDAGLISSDVNIADGATLKLSSNAGDKTYAETFNFAGAQTILAGKAVAASAEIATITLPAISTSGAVTLGSVDAGYTLRIDGTAAAGTLDIAGGDGAVRIEAPVTIATEMSVSQGTATLVNGGTTGVLTIADSGSLNAPSALAVTAAADLGSLGISTDGAAFTLTGWDLSNDSVPRTVTLQGDTVTFTGSAVGGSGTAGVAYIPITNDADSGIDSGKTYTHKIDFGTDTVATINTVAFDNGFSGNGSTTITGGHNGGGAGLTVTGDVVNLFDDMVFNNMTGEIVLTGLAPDTWYDVRLYHRAWDQPTDRSVTFLYDVSDDGSTEETVTLDTNDASAVPPGLAAWDTAYAMSYTYQAETNGTLNIHANAHFTNQTFHLYGLTNEEAVVTTGGISIPNTTVVAASTSTLVLSAGDTNLVTLGGIEAAAGAALTVDSSAATIALTNLSLGGGSMIRSTTAESTSNVEVAVSGKLTIEGDGISYLGDTSNHPVILGDGDDHSTNLTLGDGAVIDWIFGSVGADNDSYLTIKGLTTLGASLTVNIVDGGGSADSDDVYLIRSLGGVVNPTATILGDKPAGWTGTLEWIQRGASLWDLQLTGLTTSGQNPGDTNGDGFVNEADRANFELALGLAGAELIAKGFAFDPDFDNDGDADLDDFVMLRESFGNNYNLAPVSPDISQAPEPCSAVLMLLGLGAVIRRKPKCQGR
jgi:autotransporter-associated beta strand protein